jgi:hypothetical protein
MSTNLQNFSMEFLPVWNEIVKYIDNGISVIPVHDRDEGDKAVKSPCLKSWKKYQTVLMEKEEIFYLMDVMYNTTAVGLIGGKVSGNLEFIDIDVKYKAGIDAVLFTDLKILYPDLLAKVRIHKTPSGGYHIVYRCTDPVEKNQKLAARPATDEELKERPKNKTYNFLETRGEAGYVLAPPALGYQVVKDVPIPVLTLAERNSLISLCRSYNEIITPERAPYKPTKSEDAYYETNPFEDFNNRCNPSEIMYELGWKECGHSNHFVWYTRPGKATGVSMGFNLQNRFYFCFTTSTELEGSKGYSPANLLAILAHGGDKKKLYADLVARGYGKIKPKVEQRLIKTAAINGKPLPMNASKNALIEKKQLVDSITELYPFGIFWIDSAQKGIIIDRFKLYNVAAGLGFKNYKERIVQVTPFELSTTGILEDNISSRHFSDTLKSYIKEEGADLHRDIFNALDAFLENHSKHVTANLPMLHSEEILIDTVDTAYKCYENGILRITADSIDLLDNAPLLIWRHNVHPRNFNHGTGGRYIEFLNLATEFENNKDYLLSCIGYLAHEYKDETTAYIIVLTEQCENPKEGGGAGKNVFCNLFSYTTTFTGKPGAQAKFDEKFMQSWNGEKIFCISDVPKEFDFLFLKDLSSGIGLMKKLFVDEAPIPSKDMPKFLVQTNYSIEIKDGGLNRRVKIIEFTDFFTKAGGIDVHFGAHFPNGWNQEDWAGFDTIMAHGIQHWLKGGRKIGEASLSNTGWMKQFEQTYGATITPFIKENFSGWKLKQWVNNNEFKTQIDNYYTENNTHYKYQLSTQKINRAIKDYCTYNGIQFQWDVQRTENGIHNKYKWFWKEGDVPF